MRACAPTEPRTYLFVRHAHAAHQSPAWEPGARATGDPALTPRGVRQARLAAELLASMGVERVVSSSLVRARETAEQIARASAAPYVHAWPELDEILPSDLRRVPRSRPEWWEGIGGAWHVHRHVRGVRGGPIDAGLVERRIGEVLSRLDALPEARIAVVGHGYWILLMALIVPGRVRLRSIHNCSLTEVRTDGSGRHTLVELARRLVR